MIDVTDALILGGGLAGSTAACLMARAGRTVRLLERETGPHHKVCGEFLSIEAATHLRQLDIDPLALGAVPLDRMRIVWGRREIEAALPFTALGLSRYALDEALIARARLDGAHVERGVRVVELNGRTARTSAGEREGRHVLVATGKLAIKTAGEAPSDRSEESFVGLKMHYRLAPDAARQLAGTIVLALFDGGYAGLQMVEGGVANLCLVLRRKTFLQLGGDWQAVREWLEGNAFLRRTLSDAEPLFERPVAIARLVYGLPPHDRCQGEALILGDRWAMTPSLTGDGMAIALRSAFLAARCVIAGDDARSYHKLLAGQTHRQIARATMLQHGLETPALRLAAYWLARACPPLLTRAAQATRLPDWSLGEVR